MGDLKDTRIRELEIQIKELKESHDKLAAHYHEFVKATLLCFKESAEKE